MSVRQGAADWVAETEDIGPRGYRIASMRPLAVDGVAWLVIESSGAAAGQLAVVGRVAWATGFGHCHHAGVAIADPTGLDPEKWFRKLLQAQPGMEELLSRVPDRLTGDTRLFLRPPPRDISDLSASEVRLLRLLGDGTTVAELLHKGALAEKEAARVIFALLERQVLTLSLGEAAPSWRWRAAIAELDALRQGRRSERRGPPPVLHPAPSPRADGARLAAPAPPAAVSAAEPRPAGPVAPVAPPVARAPVPEAAARLRRSPKAQQCFELAASAAGDGKVSEAIALLRCALALSPSDREVASLLGQLAFQGRAAPAR